MKTNKNNELLATTLKAAGTLAILLVVVLTALACGETRQPDIILVVLDTVRSDFTRPDQQGKTNTPSLDQLATGGTLFSNAWSNSPWTLPAHASIFTGALPSAHGCTTRSLRFDHAEPTMAELLTDAGYETAAFFSNPWLTDRATGLLRGFSIRGEVPFAGFGDSGIRSGGDQGGKGINTKVADWLHRRSGEVPFFLFINYLEAHLPYHPPADYRRRVLRDLPADAEVTVQWSHEFNAGLHPSDSVDWDRVRRLYAGDVHTVDRMLSALIEILKNEGLFEDTILIVTSDHGENLGDHGLMEHQLSIHETLLAVPLVIRAPGRLPSVDRIDPVMLTDLFATILDFAGIDAAGSDELSRSLLAGPGTMERPLIAEYGGAAPSLLRYLRQLNPDLATAPLASAYRTVRQGDLRLTLGSNGSVVLNDLVSDPSQMLNLASEKTRQVAALRSLLEKLSAGHRLQSAGPTKMDDGTRQKLQSLGYVNE